jgi:hypothetical protein
MKTITATLLRERGACFDQVTLFKATFGESANLNARNFATAEQAGLNVFWMTHLLPAPALAECNKVTASAWAEYDKVTAPALAEYHKVRASAILSALRGVA